MMFQIIAVKLLLLTNILKFAELALIIQDLTDGTAIDHSLSDDDSVQISISSPIYLQNSDGSTSPKTSFRISSNGAVFPGDFSDAGSYTLTTFPDGSFCAYYDDIDMTDCINPCSTKSLRNVGTKTLNILKDHFGIEAIPGSVLVVTYTDITHHGRTDVNTFQIILCSDSNGGSYYIPSYEKLESEAEFVRAYLPTHTISFPAPAQNLLCQSNVAYPGTYVVGLNTATKHYYIPPGTSIPMNCKNCGGTYTLPYDTATCNAEPSCPVTNVLPSGSYTKNCLFLNAKCQADGQITATLCPINGGFTDWTSWAGCNADCGPTNTGLTETRSRTCTNPAPDYFGNTCVGDLSESSACNMDPCPVDGVWTNWANWATCSLPCGTGSQSRTRTCTDPAPEHGGNPCSGDGTESQNCNTSPCPIDGVWTNWANWATCSLPCGTGSQSRTRTCTNPTPEHGGNPCSGDGTELQDCNTFPCPIDGDWTNWANWATCSLPCGTGSQSRTRTCTNPTPEHGGNPCSGDGTESQNCNTFPCPIHGEWGQWSNWTDCDKPCGVGFQNRSRVCDDPAPAHGGDDCVGTLTSQRQICNVHYCPEMCDEFFKMCDCIDVPVIYDMSILTTNSSFYGINDTAVNSSLDTISTWDAEAVKLACKNAECSETSLQNAITQIEADINILQSFLDDVTSSIELTRKVISCKANVWGRRGDLFDHYESLFKRKVIVRQVYKDLEIKKTILEKEKLRCADRSWLREVLEDGTRNFLG
ncbi:uncharacterized protein [Clytia hemisphaerica]|uniref:uncharacterized protein isoform X2 n=1 Tax=Clytia hemisphaerica TaxID=252671 RepID=UPI0034D69CD4